MNISKNYTDTVVAVTTSFQADLLPMNPERRQLIIFNPTSAVISYSLSDASAAIPIPAGDHAAFLVNAPMNAIGFIGASAGNAVVWEA